MRTARSNFCASEKGAVFIEALIVVPLFMIFSIGILEFGNVLWQRHQLQTGVRDAGRYWSRCTPDASGSWSGGSCSLDIARNIAFYGDPAGAAGGGELRIPNWNNAAQLTITPEHPASGDQVIVRATLDYQGSPLFSALGIGALQIGYTHTERYIGW